MIVPPAPAGTLDPAHICQAGFPQKLSLGPNEPYSGFFFWPITRKSRTGTTLGTLHPASFFLVLPIFTGYVSDKQLQATHARTNKQCQMSLLCPTDMPSRVCPSQGPKRRSAMAECSSLPRACAKVLQTFSHDSLTHSLRIVTTPSFYRGRTKITEVNSFPMLTQLSTIIVRI